MTARVYKITLKLSGNCLISTWRNNLFKTIVLLYFTAK